MSPLTRVVAAIFLISFVYFAHLAGFWNVMVTWTWNTWAIFFFGVLVAFIGNEIFK